MNSMNSKTPNTRLRHERELRGWSQSKIAGEIGTNTDRISRWECGDSAVSPYYRERLCTLFGKNAAELGLIEEAGSDVAEASPTTRPTNGIDLDGHQPIQLFIPNGTPHTITIHIHQQAPVSTSTYPEQNDIIDIGITTTHGQERPRETEGTVKRREFFQEGLRTGAAILTSYALIDNELLDRFSRALKRPSTLDERTLNYFELRTEGFWQ